MNSGEPTLSAKKVRKNIYWAKLEDALNTYKNILIVTVDFVGSKQMQNVRQELRGKAVVLMGKNTIIRKVLRENVAKNPKLEALIPHINGNMGFVFTNEDLNEIRKTVIKNKMPAAAKAGVIAPIDVTVPNGPTGLDPGQTNFFQTLGISTKITKGTIEIVSAVQMCFAGQKVSASAVALLSKLGMKPFEFGIECPTVYEDGSVYDAKVLDLDSDDLIAMFAGAVNRLACLSFAIGEINAATVPQSLGKAFMTLVAITLNTEYEFEELKAVREAMAAGPAVAAGDGAAAAAAPVVEEEEEEAAPAMDMFGGDDEGSDY